MLYDNAIDDGPMLIVIFHVYMRMKIIYLLSMMMLSFMRVPFILKISYLHRGEICLC
jgi:hypothetical protein